MPKVHAVGVCAVPKGLSYVPCLDSRHLFRSCVRSARLSLGRRFWSLKPRALSLLCILSAVITVISTYCNSSSISMRLVLLMCRGARSGSQGQGSAVCVLSPCVGSVGESMFRLPGISSSG